MACTFSVIRIIYPGLPVVACLLVLEPRLHAFGHNLWHISGASRHTGPFCSVLGSMFTSPAVWSSSSAFNLNIWTLRTSRVHGSSTSHLLKRLLYYGDTTAFSVSIVSVSQLKSVLHIELTREPRQAAPLIIEAAPLIIYKV